MLALCFVGPVQEKVDEKKRWNCQKDVNSQAKANVKQTNLRLKCVAKPNLLNNMGLREQKIIRGVPEWSSPS